MPAPVPGTVVSSGSAVGPGGDTGLTGATGPSAVSTDANNLATLGSDNLISVPASNIWSMRLRSFNSIGNPTFEVDQRQCGASVPFVGPASVDRWTLQRATGATMVGTAQQIAASPPVLVPGTNFAITSKFLRLTLTTQQASLAAGDYYHVFQFIEGPLWRELMNDVHSVSLLVRTSVAGLSFGSYLKDPGTSTKSLTKLCAIPSANTWTLIPLPNLPLWPTGNFVNTPGANAYLLGICLASGTTFMSPANDTWQNGNFVGAVGQSNFAASPVNSTFDIAFVQHEPGSCTTLQDKPFQQNLIECQRYFQKGYNYGVAPGTASAVTAIYAQMAGGWHPELPIAFKCTMAKTPTVTAYSNVTGAVNTVRDTGTGTDRGVSNSVAASENGFNGFFVGTVNTNGTTYTFCYTADTGW
jgi:hypothetical protein